MVYAVKWSVRKLLHIDMPTVSVGLRFVEMLSHILGTDIFEKDDRIILVSTILRFKMIT